MALPRPTRQQVTHTVGRFTMEKKYGCVPHSQLLEFGRIRVLISPRLQPDLLVDNRYRIVSALYWVGGSGFANLAMDEKLGRKCMIVQSIAHRFSDDEQLKIKEQLELNQRLESEARILVSLTHPNLVSGAKVAPLEL